MIVSKGLRNIVIIKKSFLNVFDIFIFSDKKRILVKITAKAITNINPSYIAN